MNIDFTNVAIDYAKAQKIYDEKGLQKSTFKLNFFQFCDQTKTGFEDLKSGIDKNIGDKCLKKIEEWNKKYSKGKYPKDYQKSEKTITIEDMKEGAINFSKELKSKKEDKVYTNKQEKKSAYKKAIVEQLKTIDVDTVKKTLDQKKMGFDLYKIAAERIDYYANKKIN